MKTLKFFAAALVAGGLALPSTGRAQEGTVVLHADRLLDGLGGVQQDRDVVVRDGRITPGDLVLMVAFGAGMTWGASLVRA